MPPDHPWPDCTPPRVLVKVCGLTSVAEARAALAAGADWIGLNFHPASPRSVSPDAARAIVEALDEPARAVGLFVDRPASEVAAIARDVGLTTVQLHGHEPPEDYVALSGLRLIRAYRLSDEASVAAMILDLERSASLGRTPDAVLVDAHVPGLMGGTGHSIAVDLFRLLPPLPRLILAGGLTPANVAERAALIRPWMVDTASGVESAPGRKDPALVSTFIAAARAGWVSAGHVAR
ncbi:phosphoribosylanthranilate isomerase [Isosphaeraceae bacterium EP7]